MTADGWDLGRVREFAPDARAFVAAEKLSRKPCWSDLGSAEQLLWGKCQGSGATPYQVTVDTSGPAVKCSCPSRKFPCKHGLALLVLWTADTGGFGASSAPEQATAWAAKRASRPEPKKRTAAAKPVDHKAQAKRLAARMELMDGGMAEFRRWITDLVADGLASVRGRPHQWWDAMAARLVDAQMPGLADRVRATPGQLAGKPDWASVLLAEVARWHLTASAWDRREQLDSADAADLRTFLGWAWSAEEVLAGQRVGGEWTVVGVGTSASGRLTEQRTWLHHAEHGYAAVLDYGTRAAAAVAPQLLGSVLSVEMALYPGRAPQRVRFADDPVAVGRADDIPAGRSWDAALDPVRTAMTHAAWHDRFPCAVADVRLIDVEDQPTVIDAENQAMAIVDVDSLPLLAITGGQPATMFGEITAGRFRPFSVVADGRLTAMPAVGKPRGAW